MNRIVLALAALLCLALPAPASAQGSGEPVRIAFIDPLTGPFAATGEDALAQFRFAADRLVNERGGVLGRPLEIVPFDNKISAKESLIQLRVAIDRGIRYIAQGNSSGVANALVQAVAKHNARNPDRKVLFLNYSAVDPALTNEACDFHHFRFDAHADIKMDALTDVMAADPAISKVYIIGQDYSFGKAVAAGATSMLAAKRADIAIVGDELHPIGKVRDFTPYARKIVASGADAVVTGNWGADMVGLARALFEVGYAKPIYTFYAFGQGVTETLGERGVGTVRVIAEGRTNPPVSDEASDYIRAFKAKYPGSDVAQPRIVNVVKMLAAAIEKAGSADDVDAVALALEGMEIDNLWGGRVRMRASDHQLIQDVHVQAHSGEVAHDLDGSGYGLTVESTVADASADIATTCRMQRPG